MGDNSSLPPIKKEKKESDEGGMDESQKWVKKNWKKVDAQDLRKLAPQQKSRYLAYEDPPKDIADAAAQSKKRLVDRKKAYKKEQASMYHPDMDDERNKHALLIGQLKAAEARNRIRIMRLRYEANRSQEVNHLISCQPTARKAVRLQAFLPTKSAGKSKGSELDKLQEERVEKLLEDSRNLLTMRT